MFILSKIHLSMLYIEIMTDLLDEQESSENHKSGKFCHFVVKPRQIYEHIEISQSDQKPQRQI